jgi:hypothetical protein
MKRAITIIDGILLKLLCMAESPMSLCLPMVVTAFAWDLALADQILPPIARRYFLPFLAW